MSRENEFEKQHYNKYIGKVTCAYKEDIYIDNRGISCIGAKRTLNRDKYLFSGFGKGKDPILIECPKDMLVMEFESERAVNEAMVKVIELNLKRLKMDYCIVDHGGVSPYVYIWNLKGLPNGFEREAKIHIAQKLIPRLDLTNLGKTLIPVIGAPHWKEKYNRSIHKIVEGKNPKFHNNPVGHLLNDFKTPVTRPKKTSDPDPECRQIKSSVKLSDVLSRYGMDTSRNPTKCLWHESKSGRCFRFDDEKGVWNCWNCGRSGNVFHFIMEQERCSFPEAKRKTIEIGAI